MTLTNPSCLEGNGHHTLSVMNSVTKAAIFLIYIDVVTDDDEVIEKLKVSLAIEFVHKNLGKLKYFLEI